MHVRASTRPNEPEIAASPAICTAMCLMCNRVLLFALGHIIVGCVSFPTSPSIAQLAERARCSTFYYKTMLIFAVMLGH